MEAVKLDGAFTAQLKEFMSATFVHPSAERVRMIEEEDSITEESIIFIWRAHAQKIAHGLLSLPWHPDGYLIGGDAQGEAIQELGMSEAEERTLGETVNSTERQIRKGRDYSTASSHGHFYELGKQLARSCHQIVEVNDMFGVMMITNEEFRSLIRQSARYFTESMNGIVEVDLHVEKVKVPMPFVESKFSVWSLGLYPNWVSRDETVSVRYTLILLVCLRACLRSFLLSIRFDGLLLMRGILKMDQIIHVA